MLNAFLAIALLVVSVSINAETLLVEKKVFETADFKTFNGSTINKVRVGWESYGKLNAEKDNVILITHYFTGNSHAAGKYSASDAKAGYWDAIIGPGKAIDTSKYFVISSDTLVNAAAHDKNVITTGPATINSETGKPYGMEFPVVTIRDFVNLQKLLLNSLSINKLHAVVGASMGSLQAIDWAAAYPEMVPRMISVIGMAETDAWTALSLEQWARPIRLDPNWQNGNYYDKTPPLAGLTNSLMLITQQAMHPEFINKLNATHSPLEKAPLQDINASFSVVTWLENAAAARAKEIDANHVLYLVRANQLFIAGYEADLKTGLSKIKAKSLFLPATNDLLLMPYTAQKARDTLMLLGKPVQYAEIAGSLGHLDGVYTVQQQAQLISDFLTN